MGRDHFINHSHLPMKSLPTLLLILLSNAAMAHLTDWPQWRGQARDGLTTGQAFPESLDDAHLQSLWNVPLDPSYSGPVVRDGLVYVTETANKEREVVRAFDLATGVERWKISWEGVMRVPFFARSNGSWIRSTPATDGERLYVAGMRDVLVCLEAKTGNEIWRVDFMDRFGTELPAFGFVSSPLLTDQTVIVQAGASVVSLDKRNGETVWRSLEDGGGMNGSAFSSPIIRTVHGAEQLLVQTRTELCGMDPKLGTVLWRQEIPAFRGMNILTPSVHRDTVFTATYGGKAIGLTLSQNAEQQWNPSVAWEAKLQGYMTSPVVIDGHAYLLLRNQRVACVNLETGAIAWETKAKFGKYWSLIARGDRILALDERGELLLVAADPKAFQILSRRSLETKDCWAHLAISGDRLLVRSLNRLEVFQWK